MYTSFRGNSDFQRRQGCALVGVEASCVDPSYVNQFPSVHEFFPVKRAECGMGHTSKLDGCRGEKHKESMGVINTDLRMSSQENSPSARSLALDCRSPLLVRVTPEDGRMLTTSARKADACATLLVGDTGFHTKGTGMTTAVCSFMTSTHKWPSLGISLSQPVLPLLGCRPPMIVRVTPEGGRMQRALSLFVRSCRVKIGRQDL